MARTRAHGGGQHLTRVARGWVAGEDQPGASTQLTTLKAIIAEDNA